MAPVQPDNLQQRGERLAANLPPLLVAAERVASTVAQGVHGRRRIGQGETFWQFREYDVSDQPQSIDWRQTGKSDRVFVRELEWEAAQSVWLWRDTSASMSWSSDKSLPSKRARADLLTLALAVLLIRGGEHLALLGAARRPASGRASLTRLAAEMERGRETQSGDGLPEQHALPRHGQVVLIGDFLRPLPEIAETIQFYAESGLRGVILQLLDPAEETLPYQGRVRFEGLAERQNQSWLLGKVENVRERYLARLGAQRAGLDDIARRVGWRCAHHRTDKPAETALLALYNALAPEAR